MFWSRARVCLVALLILATTPSILLVAACGESLRVTTEPGALQEGGDEVVEAGGGASEAAPPTTLTISSFSAGTTVACASRSDGKVFCWGANDYGQVGRPATSSSSCQINCNSDTDTEDAGTCTTPCIPAPTLVAGVEQAVEVVAGYASACAILADRRVQCWGAPHFQRTGLESTPQFINFPGPVIDLSMGFKIACARVGDAAAPNDVDVYCWGTAGGLIGTTSTTPAVVTALHGARKVRVANTAPIDDPAAINPVAVCAITAKENVDCWFPGGSSPNTIVPARAVDLAIGISLCARNESGVLLCWGDNRYGQLGNGTIADVATTPEPVPGFINFKNVASARGHFCAIADEDVFCWGNNSRGEVGTSLQPACSGARVCVKSPEKVKSLGPIQSISVGQALTLALAKDGTLWAWGSNVDGRLGHTPNKTEDVVCQKWQDICSPTPKQVRIPLE